MVDAGASGEYLRGAQAMAAALARAFGIALLVRIKYDGDKQIVHLIEKRQQLAEKGDDW